MTEYLFLVSDIKLKRVGDENLSLLCESDLTILPFTQV